MFLILISFSNCLPGVAEQFHGMDVGAYQMREIPACITSTSISSNVEKKEKIRLTRSYILT